MKRFNIKYGILPFIVFICGCLPSLQPLYTYDTIVFDETLLGKWYNDGGGSWSFTQDGENTYRLCVLEAGAKEASFEVHLVQVGDNQFIDLFPGENMDLENTPDMYNYNLVPAHTFMKIDLSEPNLLLQWVCFGDVIEKNPAILKHEKRDGDIALITAEPEDIQKALVENLEEVLDGDPSVLRKCPVDFGGVEIIFDQKLLGQWESEDGDYLDIIANDNGYDILYSGSQKQQNFNGILYNLNDSFVLGLYYISDVSKKSGPNMDLPPDVLIQVECGEQQLNTRIIDWDEIETFIEDGSKHSFDNSESDDVFRRIAEE